MKQFESRYAARSKGLPFLVLAAFMFLLVNPGWASSTVLVLQANDLTGIGATYSNKSAPDTLILRFRAKTGLGSLNLANFSGKQILFEPDSLYDTTQAIRFSGDFIKLENVKARVVFRNLSFIAEGSNPRFLLGDNTDPNASLILQNVKISGASFHSPFIGWNGTSEDTLAIRQCVFTASAVTPSSPSNWRFENIGHAEIRNSLLRTPVRWQLDAFASIELQSNTLVETGFYLSGLPLSSSSASLRVQNNHFMKGSATANEPIQIGSAPGDFNSALQINNFRSGYGAFAGGVFEDKFPRVTNGELTASQPASSELWLWRLPGDTLHGAFAAGGLPPWNARPGDSLLNFSPGHASDAGLTLVFATADVPRVATLGYAALAYPDSLGYRTRYLRDTALRVGGTVRATRIQFPGTSGAYAPTLLWGTGLSQNAAGLSGVAPAYSLAGVTGPFVPALHANGLAGFIARGKNLTWTLPTGAGAQVTVTEVVRAGQIAGASAVATNLPTPAAFRPLILESTGNTALALSGDADIAKGKVSLLLQVKEASLPYDSTQVQLFYKPPGGSFAFLDSCVHSPSKGLGYYACEFTSPEKSDKPGLNLGEIAGVYALAEKLAITTENREIPLGLDGKAKLIITGAKIGFQIKGPASQPMDPSFPSLAHFNRFSPRWTVEFPGREKDSSAKVTLEWTDTETRQKLYALDANQNPTLLPGQKRAGNTLTADIPLGVKTFCLAREFLLGRGKTLDTLIAGIEVLSLQSSRPADLALEVLDPGKDSLVGRPVLARLRLSGDDLQALAGFEVGIPVIPAKVADSAMWTINEANPKPEPPLVKVTVSGNFWRIQGPAFSDSIRLALLGPKPKPPDPDPGPINPIDTVNPGKEDSTDIDSIPEDTVVVDSPFVKVADKPDSLLVNDHQEIALLPGVPKDIVAQVDSIRIIYVRLDPVSGPIEIVGKTLGPGEVDTLRASANPDLGYRVEYLDSNGSILRIQEGQTLAQPLALDMTQANATLAAEPKRAFGHHLLGWSLPDATRLVALSRVFRSDENAKDGAKYRANTLDAKGEWVEWKAAALSSPLKRGQGFLLAAAKAYTPQFPSQVEVRPEPVTLKLDSGWNLVANPFPFPMAESLMVFDAAKLDRFQHWNAGEDSGSGKWDTTSVLRPFQGYAVYAEGVQDLAFHPLGIPRTSAIAGGKSAAPMAKSGDRGEKPASSLLVSAKWIGIGDKAGGADRGNRIREARITHFARGSGYLAGLDKGLGLWFQSSRRFSTLPGQDPEATEAQMALVMPKSGIIQVTVTPEGQAAQGFRASWSAALVDEQSGKVVSLAQSATLELPAGEWKYRLITGPAAKIAQRVSASQSQGLPDLTLVPLGRGGGLWRLGLPAELGYARVTLTSINATGRILWRQTLARPGAGWHDLVLPRLGAGAWLRAEADIPGKIRESVIR